MNMVSKEMIDFAKKELTSIKESEYPLLENLL